MRRSDQPTARPGQTSLPPTIGVMGLDSYRERLRAQECARLAREFGVAS